MGGKSVSIIVENPLTLLMFEDHANLLDFLICPLI